MLGFSCSSLQGFDPGEAQRNINQASIVIAGNATPNQSAVEIGGMDDLADNPNFALNNAEQPKEELMKPQLKSERVKVNELPETFDACVLANAIQLEQVIINLLTNAIQAMEQQDDKQLAILLEIRESEHQQAQTLLIHVDDNGPGFTSPSNGHFFEPFHTTKKNGLGLGLSISQQIISGINGKLVTGSSPQGGARFSIDRKSVV